MTPERSLEALLDFGIAVIDKPAGPTSHDVTSRVRAILHASRAGHGGTLDPAVTGVLPVFLGRATRLSSLILSGGKEYLALATFHRDITEETLSALVRDFTGDILQLPPVRSRVKREERRRSIYRIEIRGRAGRDVEMLVECEAGTYLRKLIHDMGVKSGLGAHMARLRRTRAGPFRIEESVTPEGLEAAASEAAQGRKEPLQALVKPGEAIAGLLPSIVMDQGAVLPVATGATLAGPGVLSVSGDFGEGDRVGLFSPAGEWVAIGIALVPSSEVVPGRKGLVATPRSVFLKT